ncbi:hypothetical protein [Sphingobium sp. YR768]|uniref:hypothetical protein n=1 Tax=Sphingobium sp. YR768 TaxID=1884365 RepID=UPI0008D1259A|nr:hypothetical protein [Sphingobium sp. YR768]SEQ59569.1 hypothetical protein SAMN05518866_101461 [Sphingobium sp. YR768]
MPATKRPKPLYQRGDYALHRRPGRTNLEIIWYDSERGRERSASAGTGDLAEGRIALDRLYLNNSGHRMCPHCHRPWEHEASPTVADAVADYLILMDGKAGAEAARHRLAHVIDYLAETDAKTVCAALNEAWVDKFRAWALQRPVMSPKGRVLRDRSLSHVEGSVMQLAAAINATPGQKAQFKARQQVDVTQSPTYRADVKTIAAMFNFCLRPEARSDKEQAMIAATRRNLLRYLQLAVASWARPETILAVKRNQWHADARVLDLNPVRRQRTNKRLPMVPIARQCAPLLDEMHGPDELWIDVSSIRGSWDRMREKLDLPGERQAGPKLIRRSISTIVRRMIGEVNWRQGEIMLGHVPFAISDIYAIPDPANLGLVLAATEELIDQIEALAPGAYRTVTAHTATIKLVSGGKNG